MMERRPVRHDSYVYGIATDVIERIDHQGRIDDRIWVLSYSRIRSLDIFRGLSLAIMTVDHFGGPITRVTQETIGFVSVAEAFVFISGIVSGLVYGRLMQQSAGQMAAAALKRARLIYFAHILSILFIAAVAYYWPALSAVLKSDMGFFPDPPESIVLYSALLLHQPQFLDILPMYVGFLLLTPLMLRLFEMHWDKLALIASAGLWGMAQLGWCDRWFAWLRLQCNLQITVGMFDPFAWQLLFVIGLWLGYRKLTTGKWPLPAGNVWVWWSITGLLFMFRHSPVGVALLKSSDATLRSTLGWLRLFNFLVLTYSLYRISEYLESIPGTNWLAFLGRHSLAVYVFHTLVLYLILPWHNAVKTLSGVWQVILALIFMGSLSFPAWIHQKWKERQRAWRKAVAVSS